MKDSSNNKSNNKSFWIVTITALVLVGVMTFGIAYAIRSKQIDAEFDKAFQKQQESADDPAIQGYTLTYDNKTYSNVAELIGVVKEPITVDIHVVYPDTEADKQAYITFNNDKTITYPLIVDGNPVHIVLPSLEADVPSYKEFIDSVSQPDSAYTSESRSDTEESTTKGEK